MSIMGGLVGTESGHLLAASRNLAGEWAIRNAWALVLVASLAFWAVLGGLLIFG